MFSTISPSYDRLNHILSLNIDRKWRSEVRREISDILAVPGSLTVDVACGTGDLSFELSKGGDSKIVGIDFCQPMLSIAQSKRLKAGNGVEFAAGDALHLPFSDASCDAATIAFGLRNLSDWNAGLRELRRVLRPGGRLVVLECSRPVVPGFRQLFDFYFRSILPRIGGMVSGSRDAYEYLYDSVSNFPAQEELAAMISDAGFTDVAYRNLTGGIVAIHSGEAI